MDKEDHMQTASWGNSASAKEYRQREKELIDQGKFKEAQQMGIDDAQTKFPGKYDTAIVEMDTYTDVLLEKQNKKKEEQEENANDEKC